jgi:ketosteroid isomerase-like protein
MSVWKRQPDGAFKVVMDVGVTTPGPVPFAPGFRRSWQGPRYAGSGGAAEARASLEKAERAVGDHGTSESATVAFRDALDPETRVYRMNAMPLVGRSAIVEGLAAQPKVTSSSVQRVEVAESGDLGWAWGSCAVVGADGKQERARYVRVWGRHPAGTWRILFDLVKRTS